MRCVRVEFRHKRKDALNGLADGAPRQVSVGRGGSRRGSWSMHVQDVSVPKEKRTRDRLRRSADSMWPLNSNAWEAILFSLTESIILHKNDERQKISRGEVGTAADSKVPRYAEPVRGRDGIDREAKRYQGQITKFKTLPRTPEPASLGPYHIQISASGVEGGPLVFKERAVT